MSLSQTKSLLTAALAAAVGAGTATADIVYIDAQSGTGGNTYATGGSLADTSWHQGNTSAADSTLWSERNIAGTNGNIFQALPPGSPAGIPELTTEVTGLADGVYDIWVFFQDNVGDVTAPIQDWVISAGLTSGSLTTYISPGGTTAGTTDAGVVNAATLSFDGSAPVVAEGSGTGERHLFAVNIGQATVTGGSTVNVFIGMDINGNSDATRVFYDGVGYELVPEPGSLALLALGGLMVARRRRG